MSGFLLDTNVISELRKGQRCAPKVNSWVRTVPQDETFISVLVVGELTRGISLRRRSDPATANALESWIVRIKNLYGDRILPVTLEVAETWGKLGAVRPIPPEDGLMAATALVHGLTLVTRNVKNVEGIGVPLVNPWI
jgi:predicted nucleic acid-binding protein